MFNKIFTSMRDFSQKDIKKNLIQQKILHDNLMKTDSRFRKWFSENYNMLCVLNKEIITEYKDINTEHVWENSEGEIYPITDIVKDSDLNYDVRSLSLLLYKTY